MQAFDQRTTSLNNTGASRKDRHRPKMRRVTIIVCFLWYLIGINAVGRSTGMTIPESLQYAITLLAEAFTRFITSVPQQLINQWNMQFSFPLFNAAKGISNILTIILMIAIAVVLVIIIKRGILGYILYEVLHAFMPRLPDYSYHIKLKDLSSTYTISNNILDSVNTEQFSRLDQEELKNLLIKCGLADIYITKRDPAADAYGRKRQHRGNPNNADDKTIPHNKIPMCVIERSGYVSAVELDPGFLQSLETHIRDPRVRHDVLVFSLVHECTHIRYHDCMNLRWRIICFGLSWLFVIPFMQSFLLSSIAAGNPVLIILTSFLLIIWLAFFSVVAHPYYWCQCAEFRADRYAAQISGADPHQVFAAYSQCGYTYKSREHTRKSIQQERIKLLKAIFGFGTQYLPEECAHPSPEMRRRELLLRKKWGLWDYFRYGFMMRMKLFSGKGSKLE